MTEKWTFHLKTACGCSNTFDYSVDITRHPPETLTMPILPGLTWNTAADCSIPAHRTYERKFALESCDLGNQTAEYFEVFEAP